PAIYPRPLHAALPIAPPPRAQSPCGLALRPSLPLRYPQLRSALGWNCRSCGTSLIEDIENDCGFTVDFHDPRLHACADWHGLDVLNPTHQSRPLVEFDKCNIVVSGACAIDGDRIDCAKT